MLYASNPLPDAMQQHALPSTAYLQIASRCCGNLADTGCVAPQAKGSQLSKQHGAVAQPQLQPQPQLQQQQSALLPEPRQLDAFAGSLRSARDIDMSLVVGRRHDAPMLPQSLLSRELCAWQG